MKRVIVEPFLSYKLGEEMISSAERQTDFKTDPKKIIKESKKRINIRGGNSFILIDPNQKECFSFIPIIHNEQFFASKFPNPIQLYFSLAYDSFLLSEELFTSITIKGNLNGEMAFVNEELFNSYLKEKISSIVFLHSTIEAFINHAIPNDFMYHKISSRSNSEMKLLNKKQIIRLIGIKEKFQIIVPQIFNLDFKLSHKRIYDSVLELIKVRDELIHLKIEKLENNLHYHGEVENIVNLKIFNFVDSVKCCINLLRLDFLKIENQDKDYFEVKFSSFLAFKTDISIFLDILKSKIRLIHLNIPYSDKHNFNLMKNWIMQNLEIMRSNELLKIKDSKFSENGDLLIYIEKTDKGFIL